MLTNHYQSPLYRIANPDSIAVFGASNNALRMGSIMLASMMALGYEGSVYPVHPSEERILGFEAYRDVRDLPETPDLALMVLPTDIVCRTMEECGQKGIRHAIVVSGGFEEAGPIGMQRQAELSGIARRYGMRMLGPNCLGVSNPHHRFNPTPIRVEGPAGFVGLASQSGSFITQMHDYLHGLGLGFSTAFSVGNEADLDLVDCLEYLGACPHTRVIALYIEGIGRGRAFMDMARSIVPHKPIVALYVGGSEAGKRAAFSHTGSLAGPDGLYAGMLRQCGIIRAHTISELFDFCLALGTLPRPNGCGVVIQTHSGGPGATAADSCERAGLSLPTLSKATIERLEPFIPHTASINNPVDITFSNKPLYDYKQIPDALLKDEHTDILMIYLLSPHIFIIPMLTEAGMDPEQAEQEAHRMVGENSSALLETRDAHGKPVVGYTYRSLREQMVRALLEGGLPVYNDPDRAARALAALIEYHRLRDLIMAATRGEGDPQSLTDRAGT